MTFSYETKKELTRLPAGEPECALAELSAILHACGSLGITSVGRYIEIVSDNGLLRRRVDILLEKLYGAVSELTSFEGGLKNRRCRVRVMGEIAEKILFDCSLLRFNKENLTEIVQGIDPYLVNERAALESYVRGAFLGAGTVSVPQKAGKGGYRLAFSVGGEALASDLMHLLAQAEIVPGCVAAKGGFVVYLRGCEAISDTLALMGASKAVLRLNSAVAERGMRNRVNRQTNFIGANLGRSSAAAAAQIQAIRAIEKRVGLDALPQELRELAEVRLKYPEYSMAEIMPLLKGHITKSGINHRFERLIKIAKE